VARPFDSLFYAVVVVGAALPACAKPEGSAETAPKPRPAAEVSSAVLVPSSPLPEPEPSRAESPSALPRASPPPVAASAAPGIPSAPARPRKVASRPCPPGSEMPFPPCYYIL